MKTSDILNTLKTQLTWTFYNVYSSTNKEDQDKYENIGLGQKTLSIALVDSVADKDEVMRVWQLAKLAGRKMAERERIDSAAA